MLFAIRSVILAYERKAASDKAHNFSQRGYLVVCDRYPGLHPGKMDSPRIPNDKSRSMLYQFLYRFERSLYNSIQPANDIFHLHVPLEVSIERNNARDKIGKETNDEIRERFRVNSGIKFLSNNYHIVDASVPFKGVFSKVSYGIWKRFVSELL
jgi:thymidylate kinase